MGFFFSLKPFNKCHSQYFLIIYKKNNKPATAKLYILTNYFLSVYNAAVQEEGRRVTPALIGDAGWRGAG